VKKPEADPVIARNRKAAHDYHLGESWEAGIVLQGAEVKALRAGASLVGGFATVEDREIWLHGMHIPQYSEARWFNDGSTLGSWRPSIVAMTSSCSRPWTGSGWAKMVRIAAATMSAWPARRRGQAARDLPRRPVVVRP
jgi:hypothetical protein